jgi:transcriptional regulator with XRE-family HTH domain
MKKYAGDDKKVRARRADSRDAEVGRRVRSRRLECKLSQTELADRIGVTFQQVQKYEKGVNRIGAGRLQRISEALEVPISFFFGAGATDAGREKGARKHLRPRAILKARCGCSRPSNASKAPRRARWSKWPKQLATARRRDMAAPAKKYEPNVARDMAKELAAAAALKDQLKAVLGDTDDDADRRYATRSRAKPISWKPIDAVVAQIGEDIARCEGIDKFKTTLEARAHRLENPRRDCCGRCSQTPST